MPQDPSIRQLKIKMGTVKRTMKEFHMYVKEEQDQRAKIEKMKADKVDERDMKQQYEVLNDTLTVLPDTLSRLQQFHSELALFLEEEFASFEGKENVDENTDSEKQILEARELAKEAAELLKKKGAEQ